MIFISHKDVPDHGYALRIAEILEANGIEYWLAPENIQEGKDFSELIPQAINCCEIFILVLTKDTAASAHVRKEVNLAITHKKTIIPLKIGTFDLDDSYEYLLANIQIVSFAFSEEEISNLIARCKLGERKIEMEIKKNPSAKLVLLKGDFQDNLMYLLKEDPVAFEKTLFAIGIDCSSRLDISCNVGILKAVYQLLNEEFGITIECLQKMINKAKKEQLGHSRGNKELNYKDILIIKVPLSDRFGKKVVLNLLLVANSKKRPDFSKSHDVDDVEGIDSREVIFTVFKKCTEIGEQFSNLFIGAMGTNGLKFPYGVVVSAILNCYVYANKIDSAPRNLFFSMRSLDMSRSNLNMEKILSYISAVVNFVK